MAPSLISRWIIVSASGNIDYLRVVFNDVVAVLHDMMTSSNGNIFRVIGPYGEFTGEFSSQRPVTRNFNVLFDREAGILSRHRTHYDVIVMRNV